MIDIRAVPMVPPFHPLKGTSPMPASKQTIAIRKKIIKLMPRPCLEAQIDNEKNPWHWDRATLEERVLAEWSDDMRDEFLNWLRNRS